MEETPLPHVQRWRQTRTSFNQALRSTTEPFDSWVWIYRLGTGLADYIYYTTCLNRFLPQLMKLWRPATPAIAVFLILLTLTSYFASFRVSLVRERWCPATQQGEQEACAWEYFHTLIVIYLGTLILYNYILVIFESPGVVLRDEAHTTTWHAMESQGGFLGWNATLNVAAERERVALYGSTSQLCNSDDDEDVYPSVQFSFCKKCEHWRPPRCHHCSTCNRCVLQMDHHCPWVNNCIGYNNNRTFFLALTFLMVGCWYGALLIMVPFLEEIQKQIHHHGLRMLYSNMTGFLDLPSPITMIRMCMTDGGLSLSIWIKMICPLLVFVGIMLTVFWAFHFHYILTAQTTLEEKVTLFRQRTRAFAAIRAKRRGEQPSAASQHTTVNPFHQASKWKNLRQILGPNLLLLLLPFRFGPPPPPYIPPPKSKGI